ncbi:MAG: hypothetical protein M4D80_11015 [Myxococcota bacterium]|nr:hypothetical protein [Myxococcota bacterium]
MRPLLLVLILSATTFGCSKKEKESATTTEGATAKPTTGDQPKTDRAADDKATEDLQARRAEEAKAAEAKAAADAEAVKAHAATHEQLQANFDAANRRFNTLKEKADKLTGAKKKNADAAVAAVKTAEATMMANVAKLREASAAQWDAAKAQVEADAVALNKSIDALETAVK